MNDDDLISADDPPVFGLQHQLCFASYSATLAFNRAYRAPLDALGLTYPQCLVLMALWERDNIPISEIGEQLALETNTLTPMLKRLEKMALLERRRDSEDERRVLISLTEAGRALQPEVGRVMQCLGAATKMTRGQVGDLIRELKLLRKNLDQLVSAETSEPGSD